MKFSKALIISIFVIPLVLLFYLNSTTKSYATTDLQTNKPEIIKFSSSMCGECKRTDKELKPLFEKYKNEIIITNISTDVRSPRNNQLMKKYRIYAVPTIVILKKDKSVHKQIMGFCDFTTMEKYFREILK